MTQTQDVSVPDGAAKIPPPSSDTSNVSPCSGKDLKSLKGKGTHPTPAKLARTPRGRGNRPDADHARKFDEVDADLDLAAQSDQPNGVPMETKREVSRLLDGTARAKALAEVAKMNSHEKILRVLSYTLLRLLRRKIQPDEANAVTRLCGTAQKSLDLLGLTGKEAAALADLEPATTTETDAEIRARVNAKTEEEKAAVAEEPDTVMTTGPVETGEIPAADAAELQVDVEPEPAVQLDEEGDALPIQTDMGPGD